MKERELTCMVCPHGCTMTVTLVDGEVTDVTGNGCSRGDAYAGAECAPPVPTASPADPKGT